MGVCECFGRSQLALWCLLKNNNNLKLTLEKELYRTLALSILMRRQSVINQRLLEESYLAAKNTENNFKNPSVQSCIEYDKAGICLIIYFCPRGILKKYP